MEKNQSNVDRIHNQLRQMAADFVFKPDARINESALVDTLNASRTPIREALNRLAAEGYLTFQSGRGFFCRSLSPGRILELYEARVAVECEAVRRAVQRATDAQIAECIAHLDETEPRYDTCENPVELLAMDEAFHIGLARLSGNGEFVRMLENLNGRVRYVRLINIKNLRSDNPVMTDKDAKLSVHRTILNFIAERNLDRAVQATRNHIERRREQATEAVRIAFSQLYVPMD